MDQLSRLGRNADLLAVTHFEADAGRLATLGIGDRNVRDMQRRFLALDPALRTRLRRLAVTRVHIHARPDDLHFLGNRANDFARLALVLAGEDDDLVALTDLGSGHGYSTSGARLMIFMCLRARSSRTTGPKIRVPIGSSFLLTSTAALLSKRITEPSGRRMSLAVRTITARWTSPFFTRPRGAASLTLTTMMSPTPAVRRFQPPSTLMHWTRFAPLLSATSRLDCIWSIVRPLSTQIFAQASALATSSALALPLPFDALAGFSAVSLVSGSGSDDATISGSAMSTVPTFAVPIRSTTCQVFSFEIGAHSTMRTISPTWNSFAAS